MVLGKVKGGAGNWLLVAGFWMLVSVVEGVGVFNHSSERTLPE